MHEMKEKLIKAGTDILNASKTELYVSMRFLDIALNSLGYEMDWSLYFTETGGSVHEDDWYGQSEDSL